MKSEVENERIFSIFFDFLLLQQCSVKTINPAEQNNYFSNIHFDRQFFQCLFFFRIIYLPENRMRRENHHHHFRFEMDGIQFQIQFFFENPILWLSPSS